MKNKPALDSEYTLQLFEQYMPLAQSIARKHASNLNILDLDDLYQAAYMGLLHAARNYNENFDCLFSTYAHPCIEGYVLHEIQQTDYLVYIPRTTRQAVSDFYNEKNSTHVTLKEFAKTNKRNYTVLHQAVQAMRPIVYIDAPLLSEEEVESLEEALADPQNEHLDLYYADMQEEIERVISEIHLSDREKELLSKYFRFNGEKRSYEDLGKEYEITRDRTRQIINKALRKIRIHNYRTGNPLHECLELCEEYEFDAYS